MKSPLKFSSDTSSFGWLQKRLNRPFMNNNAPPFPQKKTLWRPRRRTSPQAAKNDRKSLTSIPLKSNLYVRPREVRELMPQEIRLPEILEHARTTEGVTIELHKD